MIPEQVPAGVAVAGDTLCPLCGRQVTADPLGLLECSCGWGGPSDPLESARGIARMVTRADRNLANAQARRDLQRLAARGDAANTVGIFYIAALTVISTLIYLALFAALTGLALALWSAIIDRAWLVIALCVLLATLIIYALLPPRQRIRGVIVTRERFPQLVAALDDVAARVGTKLPGRIVLEPGVAFAVYQHHPLRRLFLRERVLFIGAAGLQLMSDQEMKSILAHELAHFRHGDTWTHRFFGRAETALRRLIDFILDVVSDQHRAMQGGYTGYYRYRASYAGLPALIAIFITWTLLLPFRLLWTAFHLLRLRESRAAEFAADRVAIHAYGPVAFINGLSGIHVVERTLRGSGQSLRQEMHKHNNQSFYAELRRHYTELPATLLSNLRLEAVREFRSLERTHPITPDRLRAAYMLIGLQPATSEPPRPASELLVPAGEASAEPVERELTVLLFA